MLNELSFKYQVIFHLKERKARFTTVPCSDLTRINEILMFLSLKINHFQLLFLYKSNLLNSALEKLEEIERIKHFLAARKTKIVDTLFIKGLNWELHALCE